MVFAFGRLREERRRGREEGRAEALAEERARILAEAIVWAREAGREDMARAMRALGRPEIEIQQALDWLDRLDGRKNGESGA